MWRNREASFCECCRSSIFCSCEREVHAQLGKPVGWGPFLRLSEPRTHRAFPLTWMQPQRRHHRDAPSGDVMVQLFPYCGHALFSPVGASLRNVESGGKAPCSLCKSWHRCFASQGQWKQRGEQRVPLYAAAWLAPPSIFRHQRNSNCTARATVSGPGFARGGRSGLRSGRGRPAFCESGKRFHEACRGCLTCYLKQHEPRSSQAVRHGTASPEYDRLYCATVHFAFCSLPFLSLSPAEDPRARASAVKGASQRESHPCTPIYPRLYVLFGPTHAMAKEHP